MGVQSCDVFCMSFHCISTVEDCKVGYSSIFVFLYFLASFLLLTSFLFMLFKRAISVYHFPVQVEKFNWDCNCHYHCDGHFKDDFFTLYSLHTMNSELWTVEDEEAYERMLKWGGKCLFYIHVHIHVGCWLLAIGRWEEKKSVWALNIEHIAHLFAQKPFIRSLSTLC